MLDSIIMFSEKLYMRNFEFIFSKKLIVFNIYIGRDIISSHIDSELNFMMPKN